MLGRQVGISLLRLPASARLALRPSIFSQQYDSSSRVLALSALRSYATPQKPRKAVGEPSRPVKRAVKRAAKSPSTGEAGEQLAEKKKAARAKKTAGTTKKKTAPKAKKPAPPKKRVKKPLTEEEKTTAEIKALKKTALSPPPSGTKYSARNAFIAEATSKTGENSEGQKAIFKSASARWYQLTPAELEHYNHVAVQERSKRIAEYKSWVESHTVDQIRIANNARTLLRRKFAMKNSQKYGQIPDERQVKRPVSAYFQFSMNRQSSGDFRNIAVGERAKLIAQEWKALNELEKKKYQDLQHQDQSRYRTEVRDVFGYFPATTTAAAAAAA